MTTSSPQTPREAMATLRANRKTQGLKRVQVDALPAQVHEALVKWANGKGIYVRDAAGLLIAEGLRQKGALSPEATSYAMSG